MTKRFWLLSLFWFVAGVIIFFLALILLVTVYFELQLPSRSEIRDVHLEVPLRVMTSDGKLIAEYGAEKRIPVPLNQIPQNLINATLATEDQRYYSHSGVDVLGLLRASVVLVTTGHKEQGGSTITMQVARNYFLTRKKTFNRKIREILLAYKIDHTFSKDKVLELYFNKIFYGTRAYGVAAAAQTYYGKQLNQLTLAECATISGIPQAPSSLNPLANAKASMERRNHVLKRMLELDYITKQQFDMAVHAPNTAHYHGLIMGTNAPYVGEVIRAEMVSRFGDAAYSGDYVVYTTINSHLQNFANEAVRNSVLAYDHRHGYRGPAGRVEGSLHHRRKQLNHLSTVNGLRPAMVTQVNDQEKTLTAQLANGMMIIIPWDGMKWARHVTVEEDHQHFGPMPTQPSDIVQVDEVIYVRQLAEGWELSQVPRVEAALVSMNPQDGSILAMVGGFSDNDNNFDHAIQAYRQPGSGFKTFIYSAALNKGFTLASMINDAPVVLSLGGGQGLWRPQNDTRKFYGPTTLLTALTQSRNLVSIRLLQAIGVPYAIDYATRFGFQSSQLPKNLTLALGTASVTPLQMSTAYSIFANGGYGVLPHLVSRILDSNGKLVFQPRIPTAKTLSDDPLFPKATQVITPQNAFLITEALKNVIQRGTAKKAASLNRPDLAGKTGTTSDTHDAWFNGYNYALETTVWVGFDQPRPLFEFGSKAALPMWIDFMSEALAGTPLSEMPMPANMIQVRIDPATGLLARPGDKNAITEYFEQGHVPTEMSPENTPVNQPGKQAGDEESPSSNNNKGGNNGSNEEPTTVEQQLY